MTDGRLSNEELAMSDTLSDKYADLPLDQLSKRLRDKASFCESADGGWRDVTAALLREADRRLSTLQRSADQMREALERIAAGDGVYGAQAHEYKQIARAALNGPPQDTASEDTKP